MNNLQGSIYLTISFFIIILSLFIIYFSKERNKNIDNYIYPRLMTVSFLYLFVELISYKTCFSNNKFLSEELYPITLKALFCLILLWLLLYFIYYYILFRSKRKKENAFDILKRIRYLYLFYALYCLLILISPMEINIISGLRIPTGLSVILIYIYGLIIVLGIFTVIIVNIKNIKNKKCIPILIFLVVSVAAAIVQYLKPEMLLINMIIAYTTFLMYFTIENPDAKLLEYEKREKELAVAASEAKSAFLSSMSHELRTPLNAIVGLSEDIMTYQDKVPQEVKEDSIDIVNASNTLLEIIGNILDISKIEGGKLELIESDYLPKEEVESLLKLMRVKVEEKDLILNSYIDPNIPECLYGDRLRIKQIINNFLSNAIKYTEKGSVNFSINWVNDSLEIKVSDTGRGIKEEDRDKLFTQFERLNVEKTSSVQGTGLGLSITKNLVELMGGSVKVDSVYGQGSTFSCIIPQKIGNKDLIVREALSADEKQTLDFSGKHLLIVDDNKLNIKVLKKAIESFHFEIDECYDGKTAIDKINAGNYDLIFMDIMMPIMGGEEAIKILKENPDFKIPVVALTADAVSGAKERYLSCGFVDYVAKPFSRDDISTKLDKILNTK